VSQLKYHVTLIVRNPRGFIFGLVMPALLLALESSRNQHPGASVVDGIVAGLVVFGMLNLAYLTYATGIVVAREDGVLRRWYASPLPRWKYFAARVVAAALLSDAAALVLLLVAASMVGLHLTVAGTLSLLLAVTIGSIALAAAGTAVTPLLPPGQGMYSALAITYLPLLIFSGGFNGGADSGLPHWLTTLMTYLPVQPIINGATSVLEHPGFMPGRDVLVLALWTVGSLALSVRFFRWDPTRPAHAKRAPAASTTAIYASK
jgi:ABC-2 type transport system permease protein